MFDFAMAAVAMDYETLVFLTLDGGLLVRRRIIENLGSDTRAKIMEAMKQGVKLVVCSAAVQTYGIKKEEIFEGIDIWGIASFYEFAKDSIVLSW